jgi:hypothetical protein
VQFCSNSVTGMMIAPAFGWVSDSFAMGSTMPIFRKSPRKSFGHRFGTWPP